MELINVNKNSNFINKIEKIYLSSFPADERMDFSDILEKKPLIASCLPYVMIRV